VGMDVLARQGGNGCWLCHIRGPQLLR
jgi:hypothetical protein